MSHLAKFSAGWTEPEQWAWKQIEAGEPADFNARDRRYYIGFNVLDPCNENGWAENRRLRVKFLQDILMKKFFADPTPDAGVRILGALIDNVPLNLEHTRLRRLIWEHSRILTDVKCRGLRVDGEFSLEGSFVGGHVDLTVANIGSIGMAGSTIQGKVGLNSVKVGGSVFLRGGANFKAEVDLIGASIGADLDMSGATF
jgi:hypothetical protein